VTCREQIASGGAGLLRKQLSEKIVLRDCEGIDDGNPAPGESFLHVLGEKQAAARFRCRGKDNGVPDAELMIRGEIGGGSEDLRGGFNQRERILPAEDGAARFGSCTTGFADQEVEQFAQDLHGHQRRAVGQFLEQFESDLPAGSAVYAFGVGENVGIERDPHAYRS